MEQEIGHSEVCNSLKNQDPYSESFANGQSYVDDQTYDTCMGGSEGPNAVGEGPCSPTTGLCQNATTQGPNGPVACPNDNPASGSHCEYADAFCFPKGARTVVVNGVTTTAWADANQCFADRYQNGDLDFDGLSYISFTWPNGSPNHPTAFQYVGPFSETGRRTRRSSSRPTSAVSASVQHGHRRRLHGPADQRAVLPVLVAQPAVQRARVA